nr:hypothetical protein [Burkholderia stagnalis]
MCVVLGQVRTADKSNEITAIPELLDVLLLNGAIVTIDAMGCQQAVARQLVVNGADLCWRSRRPSRRCWWRFARRSKPSTDSSASIDGTARMNIGRSRRTTAGSKRVVARSAM